MLIDKGASIGEVVTLKLTSGEEVIAKLVEDTETTLKLSKPLVLTMAQQGLGMAPYLFTVDPDKEVKINKSTVVVMEASAKPFADQYIQGTTGIAMATTTK